MALIFGQLDGTFLRRGRAGDLRLYTHRSAVPASPTSERLRRVAAPGQTVPTVILDDPSDAIEWLEPVRLLST